jgi:hypothetical protein
MIGDLIAVPIGVPPMRDPEARWPGPPNREPEARWPGPPNQDPGARWPGPGIGIPAMGEPEARRPGPPNGRVAQPGGMGAALSTAPVGAG